MQAVTPSAIPGLHCLSTLADRIDCIFLAYFDPLILYVFVFTIKTWETHPQNQDPLSKLQKRN